MVSIINITYGIKEPTHGCKKCINSQMLIFGGYLKVGKSLCPWVITWVNTILNHIDARATLPRYDGSCMVYRPEWY